MAQCTKCGHINGELEDTCVQCTSSLVPPTEKPSDRSRSRERRERERKEKEQAKEAIKDMNDLLTQLDFRAERREQQFKQDLAKLLDDNDEKPADRVALLDALGYAECAASFPAATGADCAACSRLSRSMYSGWTCC